MTGNGAVWRERWFQGRPADRPWLLRRGRGLGAIADTAKRITIYRSGRRLIAAALWAVATIAAQAGACRAVDLKLLPQAPAYPSDSSCRTIEPPPFDKMPLSQGDTAICFAYATAGMISRRVGFEVSPLDVATTFFLSSPYDLRSSRKEVSSYLKTNPRLMQTLVSDQYQVDVALDENPRARPYIDRLEGGEEDAAALMANLKGLCRDADLPSHDGFEQYRAHLLQARFVSFVRKLNMCYRALVGTARRFRERVADHFNVQWLNLVQQRCQRTPSPVPLLPVSLRIAQDQEEFSSQSEQEDKSDKLKSRGKILDMIDYALNHGRHPVVGYSYYVLQLRALNDPDRFADHSSVVVGRKKMSDGCYYMVEDNSGEFCHRFYPQIRDRCLMGRIWLSRDELLRSVYSVIYLR